MLHYDRKAPLPRLLSLNPCCNGIYSMRKRIYPVLYNRRSLNPCCNGIYSMSRMHKEKRAFKSLNPCCNGIYSMSCGQAGGERP